RLEPLLQRLPTALVLGQRDGGEQVRLGQAFQLPLEGEPVPAQLLPPGLQLLRQPAAAVRARQRLGDRPRLGEQLAQVPPDEIVEPVRRGVARRARLDAPAVLRVCLNYANLLAVLWDGSPDVTS